MTDIVSDLLGKTVRVSRNVVRTERYQRDTVVNVVVTVGKVRAVAMTSEASVSLLIQVDTSEAEFPDGGHRTRHKGCLFVANVSTDEVIVQEET